MKIVSLADMKVGQSGVVEALEGRGNIQHRLVDMGVVKGSHITVFKKAPLGDPVEVIKGVHSSHGKCSKNQDCPGRQSELR